MIMRWLEQNMFHLKRDSALWVLGLLSALLTFVLASTGVLQEAFPSLTPAFIKKLELVSGLVAALTAYLRMSPLDITEHGRNKLVQSKLNKEARSKATRNRYGAYALAAAIAGSSACASGGSSYDKFGVALTKAESAVFSAVGATRNAVYTSCDLTLPGFNPKECSGHYLKLQQAIEAGRSFSLAVRENNMAEVPAMLVALDQLRLLVQGLWPDANERRALVTRIESAIREVMKLGESSGALNRPPGRQ